MKRKQILLGTILGIISLGFTSCSDFLSVERYFKDRQSEERIFKSRDYTEQWLAQAYTALLGQNMDISSKDRCLTNFADDMYFGDRGQQYKEFINGEYNENTFAESWIQAYIGIRQASILINNVDMNEDFTKDEIKDVKAQARFLRAYLYWLLLKKYGPVPLIPVETVDYNAGYEATSFPRNSYDECVEFISSEMILAACDLPLKRDNLSVARPTRGAALATRAKAYLYAASPLANGNTEMADFTDDKGRILIPQEYDESKWAKAAAASLDVIKLNTYKLYTAARRTKGSDAYPETIEPPHHDIYSKENFPNGWADIDPFESYRSIFNGDLYATENPELIFTRGQNFDGDGIDNLVRHQLPRSAGGYCCHGVTGKQCDAYEMANGTPFIRQNQYGYVTEDEARNKTYGPLREGVSLEYANREPRFYASVAFNGAFWPLTSAEKEEYRNKQIWYYRDSENGRNNSERWLRNGIGMMKYVNPKDNADHGGSIVPKVDTAIRYADILLMYAEALNEIDAGKHYPVASWDGSENYDIYRNTAEMSKAVSQVRIRAGVPDFDENTYLSQKEFRIKLKHERQIELFAENQRYYDLRRWKNASEELSEQVYGCNALMTKEQRDLFHTQVNVPVLQATFSRKMYFWPVYYPELKNNPHMTQAPGWTDYD